MAVVRAARELLFHAGAGHSSVHVWLLNNYSGFHIKGHLCLLRSLLTTLTEGKLNCAGMQRVLFMQQMSRPAQNDAIKVRSK